MEQKKNKSALRRWVDQGSHSLDSVMEEALRPEEKKEESAQPGETAPARPLPQPKRRAHAYADAWWYRALAILVCVSMIGLLLFAVTQMPRFGSADTLIDSELTDFYVTHTRQDTGAENIVTGIILHYRGFDTLGETNVLFVAVCAVLLMLSIYGEKDEKKRLQQAAREQRYEPDHDVILRSAARILTPMVLVLGLYIIFNGHLSPGGGFSGGAVLGAGLILYQNAFGYRKTERFFTYKTFRYVSLFSLLFYALAKGYHFFTGANGLESGIPLGQPGAILSAGLLLPLNFVVGCVVACTMYALYTMFRRGEF